MIHLERLPWRRSMRPVWARLAVFTLASALIAENARAEVQVQGDAAALRVQVKEARVDEVLSALATLHVSFRTPIALDRIVDGLYAGPLGRVLPRLLDGYNFIVVRKPDAAEVIVIGTLRDDGSAKQPVAKAADPPSTTNLARNSR